MKFQYTKGVKPVCQGVYITQPTSHQKNFFIFFTNRADVNIRLIVLAVNNKELQDQQLLKEIFQRYIDNKCSKQEVQFLLKQFRQGGDESALREIIAGKLNEYPLTGFEQMPKMKRSFDETLEDILVKINDQEDPEETKPSSSRPLILKLTATLVVAALIFEGLYSHYHSANKVNMQVAKNMVPKASIKPGSDKAILTLQDGSTIVLNDAKDGMLAQQGNTKIVKLANGQVVYDEALAGHTKVLYNTMTTPRGGQYKLTLPDGTEVWLNSASSITYPTAFVGNERKVTITGEAYFEVAKDKSKPFHVAAGSQNIEVLGTHFNVMAYADESAIKTTLLEGSVKITDHHNMSILKPGEQAIVDKQGDITVKPAIVEEALAWKNGYFKFNRVDIKYIMRQIARWYDIDVVYEGDMPADEFVGKIGRHENILQVLRVLELEHVHFKIDDKKITVLP